MRNQQLNITNFLLVILYLFAKVTNHGRPQGGAKPAIAPQEIGTKNKNF